MYSYKGCIQHKCAKVNPTCTPVTGHCPDKGVPLSEGCGSFFLIGTKTAYRLAVLHICIKV